MQKIGKNEEKDRRRRQKKFDRRSKKKGTNKIKGKEQKNGTELEGIEKSRITHIYIEKAKKGKM
jgi:hypothetical protein